MNPDQTLEEFRTLAHDELLRAYAGTLRPETIRVAVAEALSHASASERRVRRLANPLGHLFRVGALAGSDPRIGFRPWSTDQDAPGVGPDLVDRMARLGALEAAATWLVRGCGWTNVQVGEGLGISAGAAAEHLDLGTHALVGGNAAAAELDRQLRALADHRVTLVPEAPADHVAPTEPATDHSAQGQPAGEVAHVATPARAAPPAAAGPWRNRAMVAAALLAMLTIVVASTLRLIDRDSDPAAEAEPAPERAPAVSDLHDRDISGRADWASALDDGLPGTFVLAEVGTASPIQAAVVRRATVAYPPGSTIELLEALAGPEPDPTTVAAMLAAVRGDQVGPEPPGAWDDPATEARISAVDQLALLDALAHETLPADPGRHAVARDALTQREGDGWTLGYLDATVVTDDVSMAWFIGIVENDTGATWVFAHNVDVQADDGEAVPPPLEERLALVLDLLRSADAIA